MAESLPALRLMHRRHYRGAYWSPTSGWYAQQSDRDGVIWNEDASDEIDAAQKYDDHIRGLYGEDGLYNFPREGEKSVFCNGCEQCGPS